MKVQTPVLLQAICSQSQFIRSSNHWYKEMDGVEGAKTKADDFVHTVKNYTH